MAEFGRRAVVLLVGLALAACAATGPDVWWERERGSLDVGSRETRFVLDVADTMAIGTDARITVTTYGSSGCTQSSDTRLSTLPGVVRFEPWVLVLNGDANCPDDLRAFRTTHWYRPPTAGRFTVRVVGTVNTPLGPVLDSVQAEVIAR
jgi:hypothetical protein